MPPRPDDAAVDRLAKIAARLASDFAGEQAAAATLGTGILASFGLSWTDLVVRAFQTAPQLPPRASGPPTRAAHTEAAQWALQFADRLTDRECKFLADIGRCTRISAKQTAWLGDILRKLRQGGAA